MGPGGPGVGTLKVITSPITKSSPALEFGNGLSPSVAYWHTIGLGAEFPIAPHIHPILFKHCPPLFTDLHAASQLKPFFGLQTLRSDTQPCGGCGFFELFHLQPPPEAAIHCDFKNGPQIFLSSLPLPTLWSSFVPQ